MKKTPPIRTCLICRDKLTKKDLIRIVRDKKNNTIFFDKSGKMNGRGAYICANEDCIDKLENVKIINNALNVNVTKENLMSIKEEIRNYVDNK